MRHTPYLELQLLPIRVLKRMVLCLSQKLEDELSQEMSKAKQISQPTPSTPEPVRFSFMKDKLQSVDLKK